jgi:hypothetical protein
VWQGRMYVAVYLHMQMNEHSCVLGDMVKVSEGSYSNCHSGS